MSKHNKSTQPTANKKSEGWPFVVYVWIFGLGISGYFIGRIGFDSWPHPVHWAAGLVGAILGYFVGWLWYLWRGDVT